MGKNRSRPSVAVLAKKINNKVLRICTKMNYRQRENLVRTLSVILQSVKENVREGATDRDA